MKNPIDQETLPQFIKKYKSTLNKYGWDLSLLDTKDIVEDLYLRYRSKHKYKCQFKEVVKLSAFHHSIDLYKAEEQIKFWEEANLKIDKEYKRIEKEWADIREEAAIAFINTPKFFSMRQKIAFLTYLRGEDLSVLSKDFPDTSMDTFYHWLHHARVKVLKTNPSLKGKLTSWSLSRMNEQKSRIKTDILNNRNYPKRGYRLLRIANKLK